MLTSAQLKQMSQGSLDDVCKESLVDLNTMRVDESAPFDVRVIQFFEQIQNPYVFRVGNTPVKVEFNPNGAPLYNVLEKYLTSIHAGN